MNEFVFLIIVIMVSVFFIIDFDFIFIDLLFHRRYDIVDIQMRTIRILVVFRHIPKEWNNSNICISSSTLGTVYTLRVPHSDTGI